MSISWGRHDDPEHAVDRILAAAEQLYVRQGFDGTTMADVADEAGCSRATLYNYFPGKRELRAALRNRAAIEIAAETTARVADIDDPVTRVTEAIVISIGRVRDTPALRVWFTPENVGITNEVAHSSDVIEAIAQAFTGDLGSDDPVVLHRRARMMVRVVISFLSAPETDEAEERALIEAFIAPALVAAPSTGVDPT